MRFITIFLCGLCFATFCHAQTISLEDIYINPQKQKLPEALILYSSANPCETCPQAIEMLTEIIQNNYRRKLTLYRIDTQSHPEFISFFHLDSPLTLVLIRIDDGAAFGYQKLTGMQSQTDDINTFTRRTTEFIDNFFGWI